jgi:hypothetical protein
MLMTSSTRIGESYAAANVLYTLYRYEVGCRCDCRVINFVRFRLKTAVLPFESGFRKLIIIIIVKTRARAIKVSATGVACLKA